MWLATTPGSWSGWSSRTYAARLAQERRWHPTQEIFPLNAKGTRVEIRFEIGRLEEVLRWVLSFGSQAKVLGPPELVAIGPRGNRGDERR